MFCVTVGRYIYLCTWKSHNGSTDTGNLLKWKEKIIPIICACLIFFDRQTLHEYIYHSDKVDSVFKIRHAPIVQPFSFSLGANMAELGYYYSDKVDSVFKIRHAPIV